MKISYNWLKKYINIDYSSEELSSILTDIGLEVGGIENFSSVKGGLKGVVIGEVITCIKHPNADKLSLTQVNIGKENLLSIVCGAPNVAEGQKVVVATVGTTIYMKDGEFEIKKAKIRGEVSEGMICAEDELGLGISHDGIMVLPSDAIVGTAAADYFKIENDIVFEIDLTPNRIDAASHIGVARDIAAWKNLTEKFSYQKPDISKFVNPDRKSAINIEIENNEACNRYIGLCLKNVKVKESPNWLKNKLKSIGLNPINNIVDITNFVLHETGHPLHAFDKSKIKGNKVIIKTLEKGTKFTTLDEIERELSNEDLMICNSEEPMCIAGVLGGTNSGITETTTDIFLESAYFNPTFVRKTAKRHAINSDASFRFERGADINMAEYAIKRAALLIQEITNCDIESDIQDIYPNPIKQNTILFSYDKCFSAIGKNIGKDLTKRIIDALEIKSKKISENELELVIPHYRVDVTRQEDLNEDILRLYGYNNIEIPSKIVMNINNKKYPDNDYFVNKISDSMIGMGFNEIMCNSLIKSDYQKYAEDINLSPVKLHNPLSKDLEIMRFSLLYSGLETISYNINRKSYSLKLFEFGRTYFQDISSDPSNIEKYYETQNLGVWLTGKSTQLNWNQQEKDSDFFLLKAYCENILSLLNLDSESLQTKTGKNSSYKYYYSYIKNDKEILRIGAISSILLKDCDIKQEVYFGEFNWNLILSFKKKNEIKYNPITKFPKVKRDLALLIDKNVSYESLSNLAKKTAPNNISDIQLFDVYSGKGIEEGKVSYAISFTLEDKNKTMTDKQIEKIMQNIIRVYEKEFNTKLR